MLVPGYLGKLAPPGSETPPNKEATESSHREPWPANAGALSVKGNEARPRVICQTRTPPEHGSNGRGLGSPHLAKGYATRAPLRKLTGVPKGSSRNVRHEQPIVSCARIASLAVAVRGSRHRSDCGMHPQWQGRGSKIEYKVALPRADSGRGGLGCVGHGGTHQSLGQRCESLPAEVRVLLDAGSPARS